MYQFIDPYDYNSIRLVKSARYTISYGIKGISTLHCVLLND